MDKFYKSHGSRMRTAGNARWWVARDGEIVAGCNLVPMAKGHWLTGLYVAPDQRNQGLGRNLLDDAQGTTGGPMWLFCEPELREFYARAGFDDAATLPAELAQRLERYRASKDLLALVRLAVKDAR
nr:MULTISPECIES: GNAT family N-acetyltransferase [unclassified Pseudomonas]